MIPFVSNAQLNETFESGTILGWQESTDLRWSASTISPISGSFSLQHNYDNSIADHDQVSYPIYNIGLDSSLTTWRFKIRHEYTPSGSNNWGVFLISDHNATQMHPSGIANGYVVGVNYHGSDDMIKLWKITSGTASEILNTGFNWQTHVSTTQAVGFQISRTIEGLWDVMIDTTGGYEELYTVGTVINSDWTLFNHFGVYYKYSSLQDMKLWLDDIIIDGFVLLDTIKPSVKKINVLSSSTLEVVFSEPVEPASATDQLNYSIDGLIGTPVSAILTMPEKVLLEVQSPFQENTIYQLSISNIEDFFSNVMIPEIVPFTYHVVRPYEILINEIMADPIPSIELPEYEFIEIFNTTNNIVFIDRWSLQIGKSVMILEGLEIPGNGYIILCSDEVVEDFGSFGVVHSISGFPALLNTGQSITLRNDSDVIISSVTYADTWYRDDFKAEGGWSLEQIDPNNPCGGANNWIASIDKKGGTPGQQNSVLEDNPDLDPPVLVNAYLLTDSSLFLYFNEPFDSTTTQNQNIFTVDNDVGIPVTVNLVPPEYQSLILFFNYQFQQGTVYEITIGNQFTDCAGNSMGAICTCCFGFPEEADSLDIVINEVLFNPFLDGVDFVEVYNLSSKILDLNQLRLASRDEQSGVLKSIQSITDFPYLFFPEEYIVFTTSASKVLEQYYSPNSWGFLNLNKLPSFPNDDGKVVLLDQSLNVIDEFWYEEEMHFPLLRIVEGVSLERLQQDRPTQDASNWHSASESCGFGTPSYENSQHVNDPELVPDEMRVEPEVFSPDNDGYHDVTRLFYQFDQPGHVATVLIFDARGRVVRKLVNNELLGVEGSFTWDGVNDSKRISSMGIYLFFIEVYDLKGNVHRYKKPCVLAKRLRP